MFLLVGQRAAKIPSQRAQCELVLEALGMTRNLREQQITPATKCNCGVRHFIAGATNRAHQISGAGREADISSVRRTDSRCLGVMCLGRFGRLESLVVPFLFEAKASQFLLRRAQLRLVRGDAGVLGGEPTVEFMGLRQKRFRLVEMLGKPLDDPQLPAYKRELVSRFETLSLVIDETNKIGAGSP